MSGVGTVVVAGGGDGVVGVVGVLSAGEAPCAPAGSAAHTASAAAAAATAIGTPRRIDWRGELLIPDSPFGVSF
ncbi:MAG TPA: hypothetical protein VEH52_12670 [Gaiellaceae bacterium]|nr:hypothetical protein [Gaiellaceae bacterium]